ncbi:MAG TPA: hypothetical protein PLB55_24015, partial [Prosthecobacter sp.]|nr:hypothetical protein [Prosthecobacter sp.]
MTAEPFDFKGWGPGEPNNLPEEMAVSFARSDQGPLAWYDMRENGYGSKDRRAGLLIEWDDETPSSPVATAPASQDGAVNLIAGLDPKRSTIEGNWSLQNGELLCSAGGYARLAFDPAPPEEYDFRIQFTRTGGTNAVSQHVVHAGRDVMWLMGGFGNSTLAFELVGGRLGNVNVTAVKSGIENGRRYESVVKVRRGRIQVELDGKLIVDHKTDGSDLSVNDRWKFPNASKLGVGCQNETVFHRIELIPIVDKPAVADVAVSKAAPAAPTAPMPAPVVPAPAAPAANDPVSLKLADLEAKFQAAFERDAGGAYKAQIAKLNTGYVTALDRALAEAAKAGKLDDAVVLREEKQRIAEGKGLPPEDLDTLPEALKKLRATWRGAEAGYAKLRNTQAAPLFDAYDKALEAFQTELTKLNKIDDALRVKTARDDLAQRRASIAPPVEEAPAPAKAAASASSAAVAIESSSSWRRAAEWVISKGGEVRVRRSGMADATVKDVKELPSGRFDIITIILNLPRGKGADITDDDLTRFNGLRGIEVVNLTNLPGVTGAGLAALAASADSMREVTIFSVGLQPQHVGFIAQFKNLKTLTFDGLRDVTSESLTRLGELKELRSLRMLQTPAFDDRALLALSGLTKLESFDTTNATFTDEGMAAFKDMKELKNLSLGGVKGVRGPGLVHISGASALTRLNLRDTRVSDDSLAAISGLTALTSLDLANTTITSACLKHLAPLKQISALNLSAENFTGVGFEVLAGCNELRTLDCGGGSGNPPCNITDDGLRDLAKAALPRLEGL